MRVALKMPLILIAVFIVSMNTALISHAQPSASANIKGYMINDYGKKCWYKQRWGPFRSYTKAKQ